MYVLLAKEKDLWMMETHVIGVKLCQRGKIQLLKLA
jgi:hypothetical protein